MTIRFFYKESVHQGATTKCRFCGEDIETGMLECVISVRDDVTHASYRFPFCGKECAKWASERLGFQLGRVVGAGFGTYKGGGE